jgi:lipoteichoic acid synthase
MIRNVFKKVPFSYLKVLLALIVTFWMLSLGEAFLQVKDEKTILLKLIAFKFLNDAWAVLLIGLIYIPLLLMLNIGRKKYGQTVFVILAILLVLGNLSLIKYSLTTLLNLVADLLGYF